MDCDAAEDRELIQLYQQILRGSKDTRELDTEYEFVLGLEIPDSIRDANGASDRLFNIGYFAWHVCDPLFLVGAHRPGEAVEISRAGFSEDSLFALAKPSQSVVDYIRGLEDYANRDRGHYLDPESISELKEHERRLAGKARLREKRNKLQDLARPSTKGEATVSESTRNMVLQAHNYSCFYCGKARPEVTLHAHHVVPRSLIKKLQLPPELYVSRRNLVCACQGCNSAKSDNMSAADVRFCIEQFSSGKLEENRQLVPTLRKIAELQNGT